MPSRRDIQSSPHQDIRAAAERAAQASMQLGKLIEQRCEGPHQTVVHRDGRPAWCIVCRHTSHGRYVPRSDKEIDALLKGN